MSNKPTIDPLLLIMIRNNYKEVLNKYLNTYPGLCVIVHELWLLALIPPRSIDEFKRYLIRTLPNRRTKHVYYWKQTNTKARLRYLNKHIKLNQN